MGKPQAPLTTTTNSNVSRPVANFSPDIWGDYFISMPLDNLKFKSDCLQVEVLKEEVMTMLLTSSSDPVEKIEFINSLCRLGVSYHFQNVIEGQLRQIFGEQPHLLDKNDYGLFTVALVFRVFRQHGFKFSCDVFKKFMDNDGKYKESLKSDNNGMLELYEAAHLRVHGEEILEEALFFTKGHLKSFAAQCSNDQLREHIKNALSQPLHTGVPRLEVRKYIDWYQSQEDRNETLLRFAKLDFNKVQHMYQRELSDVSKWYKSTNIPSELHYARHRVVETFFWSTIIAFEPQYGLARMMFCKYIVLLTVANDTYDAYGTNEEHHRFTEAIQRLDYAAIDNLPDYMKVLYKAYLDLFCECDNEVTPKGRSYGLHYTKEQFKQVVRAYQQKSEWCKEGYMPTMEEYFRNEVLTAASATVLTVCLMGMGEIAATKEFEWMLSNPRICEAGGIISRITNDISGQEDEQKRKHIPSSVQCYIKQHGVAQDKAIEELQKMLEHAKKDVNEEFMRRPTDVPMDILTRVVNYVRLVHFTYEGRDRFTNIDCMKSHIAQVFINPIPL